jgi:hypothetical protein
MGVAHTMSVTLTSQRLTTPIALITPTAGDVHVTRTKSTRVETASPPHVTKHVTTAMTARQTQTNFTSA